MKIRLLIIGSIIVVVALIISGIMMTYENNPREKVELDFMNKIREAGDDSEPMSFTVISKQDTFTKNEDYCGHAHMAVEEYWYFADVYNGKLQESNVTQDVYPWCEDNDNTCYCELREIIGLDSQSYEEFFRMHVSETCPITPMPENTAGFDPTKCRWIEKSEFEPKDCAEKFDTFYEQASLIPCDCCNPEPGEPVCEPHSLSDHIRDLTTPDFDLCIETYKDWAYMTQDNDLVWHTFGSSNYKFTVDRVVHANPVTMTVTFWSYSQCTDLYLVIQDHEGNRPIVLEHDYGAVCDNSNPKNQWHKRTINLESLENQKINLLKGSYVAVLYGTAPTEFDDSGNIEHDDLAKAYFRLDVAEP